jgi:gamma-glutamylcyclotransferase (GGCT)/AIG2-like uncharacterized protein YtfP
VLFVYGTLQFPEVLLAVIGRVPDMAPATVRGWRAAALPGRVYPGLVPGATADSTAPGQVLVGLTAGEWALLDHFEGDAYDRRELALDGGGRAWAYLWDDVDGVAAHDWDAARFAAEHLSRYLDGCAGWQDAIS